MGLTFRRGIVVTIQKGRIILLMSFDKNTKVKTNHKKLLTFVFCRQDAASEVDMCAFSRRNNSGGIDFVDFAGLILHSVYCL